MGLEVAVLALGTATVLLLAMLLIERSRRLHRDETIRQLADSDRPVEPEYVRDLRASRDHARYVSRKRWEQIKSLEEELEAERMVAEDLRASLEAELGYADEMFNVAWELAALANRLEDELEAALDDLAGTQTVLDTVRAELFDRIAGEEDAPYDPVDDIDPEAVAFIEKGPGEPPDPSAVSIHERADGTTLISLPGHEPTRTLGTDAEAA